MAAIWAVVPAAGRGTRFGGDLPKQYLQVEGRLLLAHTLDALLAHAGVAGVVLAWPTAIRCGRAGANTPASRC